jgi:hypothetical protein
MSCDFGVWYPDRRRTDVEAGERYVRLCESQIEGEVVKHPSVQAFYAELTGLHPEIDEVPSPMICVFGSPWSTGRHALSRLALMLVLAGTPLACHGVCEVVRVKTVASDGRVGVPCVIELQHADQPASAPFPVGTGGLTGGLFILHADSPTGRYRLAAQCEGYRLAFSPPFEWKRASTGCGEPVDLGSLVVTALTSAR